MKKKIIIFLILVFCLIGVIFIYVVNRNIKRQERYNEIKENIKKGVEWNLNAIYPKCSLITKHDEKERHLGTFHSIDLINEGYIKKEELLDIDKKSYCDAFVEIFKTSNESTEQNKCKIRYKIYLKCKNYEDNGYLN